MFMMLPKGTCLLITFELAEHFFPAAAGLHVRTVDSGCASAHTNRGRALKLEIKFDGRALALAAALLLLSGCGYFGWHTFRSGLELREQTRWIKAIATGADDSALDIPQGDRYGVVLMAQMAKTSGLSEADWQTFESESTNQLRNGALYMAGSVLLAGLAIERALRKLLPKQKASAGPISATRAEPAATDHHQDA
jgi:hypothetical protein